MPPYRTIPSNEEPRFLDCQDKLSISAQNRCPFLIMCLSATNIIVRCLLTQGRVLKGCHPFPVFFA